MITHSTRRFVTFAAVALIGLMAVGLVGCDTTSVPTPRLDPLSDAYPNIATVPGLAKVLMVNKAIVDPSSANRPMHVTVQVRSDADKTLHVQYRYMFLDAQGQPTQDPDDVGWKYQNLQPRWGVFLEGTALDTNAHSWRLEIRPAR